METVRVGIGIRRSEIHFRLTGESKLSESGSDSSVTLHPGLYSATVSEPGNPP